MQKINARLNYLQSDILNEYALYVLHLERALEQVDEAMNKPTKQAGSSDEGKLIKLLQVFDIISC